MNNIIVKNRLKSVILDDDDENDKSSIISDSIASYDYIVDSFEDFFNKGKYSDQKSNDGKTLLSLSIVDNKTSISEDKAAQIAIIEEKGGMTETYIKELDIENKSELQESKETVVLKDVKKNSNYSSSSLNTNDVDTIDSLFDDESHYFDDSDNASDGDIAPTEDTEETIAEDNRKLSNYRRTTKTKRPQSMLVQLKKKEDKKKQMEELLNEKKSSVKSRLVKSCFSLSFGIFMSHMITTNNIANKIYRERNNSDLNEISLFDSELNTSVNQDENASLDNNSLESVGDDLSVDSYIKEEEIIQSTFENKEEDNKSIPSVHSSNHSFHSDFSDYHDEVNNIDRKLSIYHQKLEKAPKLVVNNLKSYNNYKNQKYARINISSSEIRESKMIQKCEIKSDTNNFRDNIVYNKQKRNSIQDLIFNKTKLVWNKNCYIIASQDRDRIVSVVVKLIKKMVRIGLFKKIYNVTCLFDNSIQRDILNQLPINFGKDVSRIYDRKYRYKELPSRIMTTRAKTNLQELQEHSIIDTKFSSEFDNTGFVSEMNSELYSENSIKNNDGIDSNQSVFSFPSKRNKCTQINKDTDIIFTDSVSTAELNKDRFGIPVSVEHDESNNIKWINDDLTQVSFITQQSFSELPNSSSNRKTDTITTSDLKWHIEGNPEMRENLLNKSTQKEKCKSTVKKLELYPLAEKGNDYHEILFDSKSLKLNIKRLIKGQVVESVEVHVQFIYVTQSRHSNMLTLRSSHAVAGMNGYLGTISASQWIILEDEINFTLYKALKLTSTKIDPTVIEESEDIKSCVSDDLLSFNDDLLSLPSGIVPESNSNIRVKIKNDVNSPKSMKTFEEILCPNLNNNKVFRIVNYENDNNNNNNNNNNGNNNSMVLKAKFSIRRPDEPPPSKSSPVKSRFKSLIPEDNIYRSPLDTSNNNIQVDSNTKLEMNNSTKRDNLNNNINSNTSNNYNTGYLAEGFISHGENVNFLLLGQTSEVNNHNPPLISEYEYLNNISPNIIIDFNETSNKTIEKWKIDYYNNVKTINITNNRKFKDRVKIDFNLVLCIGSQHILKVYFSLQLLKINKLVDIYSNIDAASKSMSKNSDLYGIILISYLDIIKIGLEKTFSILFPKNINRSNYTIVLYEIDSNCSKEILNILFQFGITDVLYEPYSFESIQAIVDSYELRKTYL